MTVQLRGVLTALATPFAADGSVDEALLRAAGGPVDRRRGARGRGVRLHRRVQRVERRRAPPRRRDRRRPDRPPGAGDRADRRHEHGRGHPALPARAVGRRRRDHAGGALLRAAVGRGDADLPARRRRVRRHPGDALQPAGGDRGRPRPGHRGRAGPRGREHPLHQEHDGRHGPVGRADPQPRRRHLDLRRLGQPAPVGPGRGRRGRHGGDGERRAGRARGRLRRGERRRPRGRPAGLGADLPAHRRDHGTSRSSPRSRRAWRRSASPSACPAHRSPSSTPTQPPASRNSRSDDDGGTCPHSTTTQKPAVRRAQASGGLLQEVDLPPGQHFIDGAFRPGRVRDVHRRDRPELRAHDRPGRRGHRRGHRRRGRRRARRKHRSGAG